MALVDTLQNTICNYNNEIKNLKTELMKYKTPKIPYLNYNEWCDTKTNAYKVIYDGIYKFVLYELKHTIYYGLYKIADCIIEALNILTKNNNPEWAIQKTWDIVYGIEGLIHGFINSGLNDYICNLTPEEFTDLLYNNIEWQLDNGKHSPCILEDLAIFTCKTCKIQSEYISELNICVECDNAEIRLEYASDNE